jgi:uncharacterized protein (DUF1330 family)
VLVVRLPAEGVAAFEEYERRVLPLLSAHGGRLARRLRSADRRVEVHLVEFPSTQAFAAYRDDPARSAEAGLLETSEAVTELLELYDA